MKFININNIEDLLKKAQRTIDAIDDDFYRNLKVIKDKEFYVGFSPEEMQTREYPGSSAEFEIDGSISFESKILKSDLDLLVQEYMEEAKNSYFELIEEKLSGKHKNRGQEEEAHEVLVEVEDMSVKYIAAIILYIKKFMKMSESAHDDIWEVILKDDVINSNLHEGPEEYTSHVDLFEEYLKEFFVSLIEDDVTLKTFEPLDENTYIIKW